MLTSQQVDKNSDNISKNFPKNIHNISKAAIQ